LASVGIDGTKGIPMSKIVIIGSVWMAALAFSGLSAEEPSAMEMASVAYKVPETRVSALADAMVRHMHVDRRDIPLALDMIATCGKTGGMEFRDLVEAITTTAPNWQAAYGDGPRFLYAPKGVASPEQKAMTREDGLNSVMNICATFEKARPAYGSTADTIRAVNDAMIDRSEKARLTRAMIFKGATTAIAHGDTVRTDWRIRTGL
jgi:hypothetical protein